jgi:DNA-binding transcriptional ArsR family regulator
MDTFSYDNIEPSDMLLLRTLAVNDRTRLKMLKLLAERSYSTNDMAERLNMNASTVSRHFKVFKDAGFVDICSQEGNFIYYSLNLREIKSSFKGILDYIKEKE